MKKKMLLCSIALYFFVAPLRATVVIGDPNATSGNTFSFPVGHAKLNPYERNHRYWLASGQDLSSESDSIQQFALSYVQEISTEPMINSATGQLVVPRAYGIAQKGGATVHTYDETTKKVSISKGDNPIHGAAFSFFDVSGNKPAFVLSNLSDVFLTQEIKINPNDPSDSYTNLLKYSFESGDEVKDLASTSNSVYVLHSTGTFGTDTSKITKLKSAESIVETRKDADGNDVNITAPFLSNIGELEITTSTEALRGGGSELISIGSSVTLSILSGGAYIGINATADEQAAGILIAKSGTNSLAFDSIASNQVIAGGVNTVVSASAGNTVEINNICMMQTTTALSYLIVARPDIPNNRSQFGQAQVVYAVPLVGPQSPHAGKVADFTSIAKSCNFQKANTFNKLLTDAEQINPHNATYSEQLLVGGSTPPMLDTTKIKDLYALGDCVYVVIDQPYATGTPNQQSGTFRSQAIFAQDGHIISWTPWSRVLGSDLAMLHSAQSNNTTAGFYVADNGSGFKQVVQTQWLPNTSNLAPFFKQSKSPVSGTQAVFNFDQTTPGFNNALSLLVSTGFNNVTLGQTGFVESGSFKVKPMDGSDVAAYNDVASSTALVAAEFVHNESNHWLFTGGASGLRVLVDNNGVTWNGDLSSVADLNAGQSWKEVGSFKFIKKLVWDNTHLYIVTREAVYRITPSSDMFTESATQKLNPIAVLNSSQLFNSPFMLDLIIDDGFCILGTTNGMYTFNVNESGKAESLGGIMIPDGLPAVAQLIPVANTSPSHRNFKEKSNLYVLNNTYGTQQARINRFVILDGVVTPISDTLATNNPTSMLRFSNFVSQYFTNGSLHLASTFFLGTTQPESVSSPGILQLFAGIHSGLSSSHTILPNLNAPVPTNFLSKNNTLLGIQQESTSGALFMPGNFEARVTS